MFLPLIKSKFKVPKLPLDYIKRDNLLNKLEQSFVEEKKLNLIIASAGYGKSCLISDYLKSRKTKHLWYSFNEADSDLIFFISHLVNGLKLVIPNLKEDSLELILSSKNPMNSLLNIIGILIEDLSLQVTERFTIVFDDYQLLKDTETVDKVLEYLIEYLPENIQLILLSRTYPNLKLPQLRVKQNILEITGNELKFSKEDVQNIISNTLPEYLEESELDILYSKTDGWIGIIILLIQAYKSNALKKENLFNTIDKNLPIFDYLAQEIFELQSDDVKKFMLYISLLPKINKEICQHIGLNDFIKNLDYVKKQSILEADFEGEYRYNPIFKDFLHEKANDTLLQKEILDFYYNVSTYFTKNKENETALDYLLLSQNFKQAENLLLEIVQDFINNNRLETLNKYLQKFPEEYLKHSANLQIYFGEVNRLWGNYTEALEYYYKAKELAKQENNFSVLGLAYVYESIIHSSKGESISDDIINESLNVFTSDDSNGLALAYNTKGIFLLFKEHIYESLEYFEKSLKHYEKTGDLIGQAKVLHNLGYAYSILGNFEHSLDTYKRSVVQTELTGKYPHPMTYNNIAIIYNYMGDFLEAKKYAEKSLEISKKLQYKREQAYSYWTLGMLYANMESFQKSEEYFNMSANIGLEIGDRQTQANGLSGLSELERLKGKTKRALELIDEAIRRRDLPFDDHGIMELLIQKILICIDLKDYKTTKDYLENTALNKLEKLNYKYYLTLYYFYLSVVYEEENFEKAKSYMDKTYNLVKENNYYIFLSQQKYIPKYLKEKFEGKTIDVEVKKTIESKIKFNCFGDFKVYRKDTLIGNREWSGYKTKLAMAYLLHNTKGVTKEQLANLLYPDMDITRTAINVILSRVRKALEPDLGKKSVSEYIVFNEGKYSFNFVTDYWLDTEEFNYLVKELKEIDTDKNKIDIILKIINLYSGEFLSEFSSELWCQIEKEVYKRKIEEIFVLAFEYFYKEEEFEEIITLSEKEIQIDMCNENAFQRKIKALIGMNKKEEALKHYKIMKNILKNELGIEPNKDSYLLYQKLL